MSTRFVSQGLCALIAAACATGLAACAPNPASPPPGTSGTGTSSVSFKTTIAPMLTSSCVSCHASGGTGARDLTIADASGQLVFSTISQRAGAMLREVRGGAMPQGGPRWTTEQVAAFQTWQQAGAPNN